MGACCAHTGDIHIYSTLESFYHAQLMHNRIRTKILQRTLTFMDLHLDLMCHFSLLIFLQKSYFSRGMMGFWYNFTAFQGAQRGHVWKKGVQMPATSETIRFINQDIHSDTRKEE